MPSNLAKNAIAFLQKRYPQATVTNEELTFTNQATGEEVLKVWPMVAQDFNAGIKQRAIAVHDLGKDGVLYATIPQILASIENKDHELFISFGNALKNTSHPIATPQMLFAPRLILYTDTVHGEHDQVLQAFASANLLVDIISEGGMYKTLFISYGGPDEPAATEINNYLKSKGIKTWFFPDDALPGDKLHRVMHDGVNTHDRVLLLCSKESLSRPGVLNEIERVLEREAKEGGTDILIPVALDDYVYKDWAPTRPDIADQVRSRVIASVDMTADKAQIHKQLDKVVSALSKSRK